ncbi:MAG: hypothetical protein QG635_1687 [Bacteroidota bacterium]|nr:hypothetical protein [Bacteroidota bacterium]
MEYSQENLLDFAIINGLKELDDDGSDSFFKEIVTLYINQYPELYEKIINAVKENKSDDLSKAAHALKGASLNIGAKELASVCKEIEFKGKDNQMENMDYLLESLNNIYSATISELGKI